MSAIIKSLGISFILLATSTLATAYVADNNAKNLSSFEQTTSKKEDPTSNEFADEYNIPKDINADMYDPTVAEDAQTAINHKLRHIACRVSYTLFDNFGKKFH